MNVVEIQNYSDISGIIENLLITTNKNNHVLIANELEIAWKFFCQYFDRYIEAAGGLVRNPKGDILIIKRWGLWDLPKGKIEPGESPEWAAVREVQEECGVCGLSIKKKLAPTYHTFESHGKKTLKKTHWYLMDCNGSGKLMPQSEEDITEVCWWERESINKVKENTWMSVVDVLENLEK